MTNTPPPPYAAPPPVPGQEPRPPRPTTVTAAAGILVGLAVLSLISVIVSMLTRDTVQRATDEYLEANNTTSGGSSTLQEVIGIVFGLLFAAAFVALALGVLRGSNVARIITWVVSGLALCCVGVGTAASLLVIAKYLPGGYLAYSYTLTAVELIGFIAVIVLLALPASNAYFRKPQAGF
ncbi:hypothetical protein [Cryptosporangium minutisporangium]|uniref:Uncharacterized protein n=1 Tax=Cryptosporangium minutisporangium TaxID=113569 RepID=A0ABP6T635_9ACTN